MVGYWLYSFSVPPFLPLLWKIGTQKIAGGNQGIAEWVVHSLYMLCIQRQSYCVEFASCHFFFFSYPKPGILSVSLRLDVLCLCPLLSNSVKARVSGTSQCGTCTPIVSSWKLSEIRSRIQTLDLAEFSSMYYISFFPFLIRNKNAGEFQFNVSRHLDMGFPFTWMV